MRSMSLSNLSSSALALVRVFENNYKEESEDKIVVNALISKVATFYEKFRTAMDYGSEETIPRRAIERMLKRMLLLENKSKTIAEDLVRELIWAGYFPNATVPESIINRVAKDIDLYLELKKKVLEKRSIPKDKINSFFLEVLSCEILNTLHPNEAKNATAFFMFKNLKNSVVISDDSEQTRDLQVYIAIRKNFARDDIASLNYRLFRQIFGKLTEGNIDEIAEDFNKGYKEINYQLNYPKKERIYNHIKKITPPFLILYELLNSEKGEMDKLAGDEEKLKSKIFEICDDKYQLIRRNLKTAIIRSFIFILFTKAIFTIVVEGVFESIVLGEIQWFPIALNTITPPFIMLLVGLSITSPGKKNSELIFEDTKKLLFEENPHLLPTLNLKLKSDGSKSFYDYLFSFIWLLSMALTFGFIWLVLDLLQFGVLSKFIFIFFIAIISFLSYRIYQAANYYTVEKKPGLLTPIFDFLFVPIVRIGRSLTEGISQVNFLLMAVDLLIEAPFKGFIGFFEQWFSFAERKREEME
jgi:hypothetical protein